MSNRRFALLKHWLAGRRHGVGALELVKTVLDPTLGVKARRYIEEIKAEPPYWRVKFRGIARPLYFPIEVGMYPLEMVVVEIFHAADWHYYQIERTRVGADDIVVDCGAAEGLFCLQVEAICKAAFAIEPLPMWVQALHKTFEGADRVHILPYGLSDESKIMGLSVGLLDSALTDDRGGLQVDVRTIDSLFIDAGRRFTYLKADLEGSEMKMLRGAERSIRAFRPRIAITTYHRPDDAEEITAFLRSISPDYRVRVKGIEHRAGAPVMLHAWVD